MGFFWELVNSAKSTITQGRQESLSEFLTEGPKDGTIILGATNPNIISCSVIKGPIFMNLSSIDTQLLFKEQSEEKHFAFNFGGLFFKWKTSQKGLFQ